MKIYKYYMKKIRDNIYLKTILISINNNNYDTIH